MADRKSVNPRVDSKAFARTANTTKRINRAPKSYRGGIRL